MYELKLIIINEPRKTGNLFSESQINSGKVETNPTIVAPSPIETNKAGSAQQISVLIDVNKLKNEIHIFFCKSLFVFNFFYSVS